MAENKLQILIKGIFSRIKEKYGYTDEQALIYLKGYEDCAEEHQQSLEKRDKMLRDTVAELVEAKRLLKAAFEDFAKFDRENAKNKNCMMPEMDCADCPLSWDSVDDRIEPCHSWRYTNEALKLIWR